MLGVFSKCKYLRHLRLPKLGMVFISVNSVRIKSLRYSSLAKSGKDLRKGT